MKSQTEHYQRKLQFELDPSDLFESLNNEKNIVPLDTRQTFGYEREHIPNAINIPHRQMTAENTNHLDKSTLYVCYCDGIGCNASTKGALNMTRLGFNVKELIGGIEWWKFDGYATEGTEAYKGSMIQCAC